MVRRLLAAIAGIFRRIFDDIDDGDSTPHVWVKRSDVE